MKLLSELSRMSHAAVVCTIHQPSASVYERIDTLLLLTKGRTAYYGKAGGLMEYLASLGKPVPAGTSVSELALDLVNADFTSDANVDAIVHAWHKQELASPLPPPPAPTKLPLEPARASFLQQCRLLYLRHLAKLLLRRRTAIKLMTSSPSAPSAPLTLS